MTDRFDAIVIGAGHNGLVCAAVLAKAGKRVLVLEARDKVGGLAVSDEFAPGYSVSSAAHFLVQLQPAVEKALDLRIPLVADRVPTVNLSEEGHHLFVEDDRLRGASDADEAAWREFTGLQKTLSRFLNRQFLKAPPRFEGDWKALAKLGLDLRLLGRDDMREFLRLVGQNMHDEANARFESPLLKGMLSLDAVTGSHAGPRSPGTMISWLARLAGRDGHIAQPRGGMGAVGELLAGRAARLGADIRTSTPVQRVVVENGRVTGVEAGGERFDSWLVVSSADPKTTVQGLVGERHFETPFVRRIEHYRCKGNVAKLHLALDGLPEIPGLRDSDFASRLLIAPSEDAVELAFNPAKYGGYSATPVMEISVPSLSDPACAPEGHHVMSAIVQFAPYDLAGGWTDEACDDFADLCLATLERYLPGLRQHIRHCELLTPVDIEREFGIAGGHWHHGETALDQFMFVRPVVGASRYRMPLDGLFLCGAGTHPGGGISGACGLNAATAILHRERSR